jgi:hypothetical protein
VRAKDPKWYAKQLGPLREEIEQIDRQLKGILQARKDGRGGTAAVALDQEPEGVTTEAEAVLLQKRRAVLVGKIDGLESEARRNEVPPHSGLTSKRRVKRALKTRKVILPTVRKSRRSKTRFEKQEST